jgi:hypothetical protein
MRFSEIQLIIILFEGILWIFGLLNLELKKPWVTDRLKRGVIENVSSHHVQHTFNLSISHISATKLIIS